MVNCYFIKITIATSSVICDFDNDGSDGLLQTAHYSTLLRDEYPTGTCPKCLPHKDFVYRRQSGELSRSIKSMEQFLASQGVIFRFHCYLLPILQWASAVLLSLEFWCSLKFLLPVPSYLDNPLPSYLISTFSIMYKKPALPARVQRPKQLQLQLNELDILHLPELCTY